MIVNSAVSTAEKEFAFPPPQFRLEPPGESPFTAMLPTTVTRQTDSFDLKWVDNPFEFAVTRAEGILEDIMARSRRDVERFPLSAQVHANYGLALLNRGLLQEAATEFLAAVELSPEHFMSLSSLARIRTLQGNFEEAEGLYRKLAASYPEEIAPLVNLAYIALRENDFEGAISILKKAIAVDDATSLPRYLMAVALLKVGRAQDAIGHLRLASRSDVRSPALYQALGVAYVVAGDAKRAVRSFKTALTLAPDMKEAVQALSNVLLQHGQTESLIELLTAHLEKNPEDIPARELLARAHLEEKQYPAARLQFLAALRKIQSDGETEAKIRSRLLNNVGVCFDHQGDHDSAASWFLRAIEAHPGFEIVAHHNLARFYIRQRKFDQAWKILELCKERVPDNHETPELQALALEKQKRYEEALQLLHVEISTGKATAAVYADLGWLLTDVRRDLDSACEVMREGLEKYSDSLLLVNNLAYALLMNGQSAEARRTLESMLKVRKARPLEAQVVLTATWGLLYLWEGNLERGKEEYQKAEHLARGSREANLTHVVQQKMHLELAKAFLRQGNLDSAKAEVVRGLSVRNGRDLYEQDLMSLQDELQEMHRA